MTVRQDNILETTGVPSPSLLLLLSAQHLLAHSISLHSMAQTGCCTANCRLLPPPAAAAAAACCWFPTGTLHTRSSAMPGCVHFPGRSTMFLYSCAFSVTPKSRAAANTRTQSTQATSHSAASGPLE
jgi:hypothetical protein